MIVIYPRNAVNVEPHIVLEPANYETFNKALEKEMGKNRDDGEGLPINLGAR